MSGDAHHNGDAKPEADEGSETLAPAPGMDSWSRAPKPAMVPTPEGVVYSVYGLTDVGLIREHNEDNYMVADLSDEAGPTFRGARALCLALSAWRGVRRLRWNGWRSRRRGRESHGRRHLVRDAPWRRPSQRSG